MCVCVCVCVWKQVRYINGIHSRTVVRALTRLLQSFGGGGGGGGGDDGACRSLNPDFNPILEAELAKKKHLFKEVIIYLS